MAQESEEIYLTKALESLEGAQSEFGNRRFNNCANRCYYGAFQAAVSALLPHSLAPLALPPSG